MREYLQEYILKILHKNDFFRHSVFVGGTALRIIYDLPRFSEDLDFSGYDHSAMSWEDLSKQLKQELQYAGYNVIIKIKEDIVLSAMIKFEDLAFESGISDQKGKLLSIKIETDTRPPAGANTEITTINKHFMLAVRHNDLSSIFAGKINALLTRSYTKGRDIFDIFWLTSRYPQLEPNQLFLFNSLKQYGLSGDEPWRQITKEKIIELDWSEVIEDVRPFLADSDILKIIDKDQLLKMLDQD